MNQMFSLSIAAALGLACQESSAAITIVAPTGSTNGSVVFPADLSFSIIGSGSIIFLFLDEYVVSDGSNTFSNPVVNDMTVSINGGPAAPVGAIFFDNGGDPLDPLTENDGFFYMTANIPVVPGDILTIKAGTITYGAVSGFNQQASQTVTSNFFLVNGSTLEVIGVPVPEPSTCLMLTAAALTGMGRRRRSGL